MKLNLFQPIEVKGLNLKNRIVMPPMASESGTLDGFVTDKNIEYYIKRAEGGVGTIIVEHAFISTSGRYSERQLSIQSDVYIDGLSKIVEAVKKHDCAVGVQITHAGGKAITAKIGEQPIGPSAIMPPNATDIPREMTKTEIIQLVECFAKAALRTKRAGFDFVEIHGAHGYILNQFYSPLTNKRSDEYGGDRKNRLRLPLEVVKAVRNEIGSDFALFYRLGADDRIESGLTIEDGVSAAKKLQEAGIDMLDISAGLTGATSVTSPPACFLYMAEAIKPEIKIPIIITGCITEPSLANSIVKDNKADLVGVGRAQLKNPNWANMAREKLMNEL